MPVTAGKKEQVSSQVLPQFSGTKLGNLRFGKQDTGGRINIQYDWKVVVLYIAVNLVFLGGSLTLILVLGQDLTGYIIFGVWGILTISAILLIILIYIRSSKCCLRPCDSENIEMSRVSSFENLDKFPYDPVMNRAVVNLVHHGQDDCEECRSLRNSEDYHPFQQIKCGVPGKTFEYINTPANVNINGGYAHSPAQRAKNQVISENWINSKDGPSIRICAIVEQTSEKYDHYYDETDDVSDFYYDFNSNSNNNRIMTQQKAPEMIKEQRHGILTNKKYLNEKTPIFEFSKNDSKFYNSTNTEQDEDDTVERFLSRDSFSLHEKFLGRRPVTSLSENMHGDREIVTSHTKTNKVTNKRQRSRNSRKSNSDKSQNGHYMTSQNQNSDVITKKRPSFRIRNASRREYNNGIIRRNSQRLSKKQKALQEQQFNERSQFNHQESPKHSLSSGTVTSSSGSQSRNDSMNSEGEPEYSLRGTSSNN